MGKIRSKLFWVRYLFVFVLAFSSVGSVVVTNDAEAAQGPAIWENATKDKSKTDAVFTKAVDYILYFVFGLAVFALAGGLIALLPIVGKKEVGIETIKWACIVLVVASLFSVLLGLFKDAVT